MRKITLLLLLVPILVGCQSLLLTGLVLFKGTDSPPEFDILLKGEKRVAVVPRSVNSNALELQNAPLEIARHVNYLLDDKDKTKNKKLKIVEQSKIEAWLDNCNNDFDSFAEVGRDKSIKADIVIGFDIVGFQIRDPQNAYLMQGKCQVQVRAIDCATGKVLASRDLTTIDPPGMPIPGGPAKEAAFRPQFVQVVAQDIASLFRYHNPNKDRRIDADSLGHH